MNRNHERAQWAALDTDTHRHCVGCDTLHPTALFGLNAKQRQCRKNRNELQREKRAANPPTPQFDRQAFKDVIITELPSITDEELVLNKRARCRGLEWWRIGEQRCLAVCDVCPVQDECRRLGDAVERAAFGWKWNSGSWLDGVIAGETPDERALRRRGGMTARGTPRLVVR